MRALIQVLFCAGALVLLADDVRKGGIFPRPAYCAVGAGTVIRKPAVPNLLTGGPTDFDAQLFSMVALGELSDADLAAYKAGRPLCAPTVSVLQAWIARLTNRPAAPGWSVFGAK